jgi:F0F1-type ATP synthase assembly protein I
MRQESYRGFGDAMSRAFEFVLVPFIFGAAGWGLDHWAGTAPLLMFVLGALAVTGLFVRAWYCYDDAMRSHEARLPVASRPENG